MKFNYDAFNLAIMKINLWRKNHVRGKLFDDDQDDDDQDEGWGTHW